MTYVWDGTATTGGALHDRTPPGCPSHATGGEIRWTGRWEAMPTGWARRKERKGTQGGPSGGRRAPFNGGIAEQRRTVHGLVQLGVAGRGAPHGEFIGDTAT
jgi:hypothetical protein